MGTGKTALHGVTIKENIVNGNKSMTVSNEEGISSFAAVYAAAQTNKEIITPESDYLICLRGVTIETEAAAGTVSLDFQDSDKPVARLYTSKNSQSTGNNRHIHGAINEKLILNTTTGTDEVFILINYAEHK